MNVLLDEIWRIGCDKSIWSIRHGHLIQFVEASQIPSSQVVADPETSDANDVSSSSLPSWRRQALVFLQRGQAFAFQRADLTAILLPIPSQPTERFSFRFHIASPHNGVSGKRLAPIWMVNLLAILMFLKN